MEVHVQDLLDENTIRRDLTEDECRSMVDELTAEFIVQDENAVPQPQDMIRWAASRLFINSLDDTVTFADISTNYEKRMNQLIKLQKHIRKHDDLLEDYTIIDNMQRIAKCMRSCFECLRQSSLLYHKMDPMRENRLPPETDLQTILTSNEEKLKNFQKLIIYFTEILASCEYRKMDDECWVQVMNSQGIPTQSWKKALSIQDMLYRTIKKEKCFTEWTYLTDPKDNAKHIVEYLIKSEECEFPSLIIDRHKWSYDNGIYDAETDTFWKYAESKDWKTKAEELQNYRRERGWGDDYTIVPPDGKSMTVKYFEQPFRFTIDPTTEETFDVSSIVLPELEIIFESQKLDVETQKFCLVMLARLFFKVQEKDKWQVVFFIKGVAQSGKSTLARLIRYMYPSNLITTLSSNTEQKFGLSAIYKGLICICAEVREDFGLDQADWQSAASGEEVSIAVKNKTAMQHRWDTPFFFLGNQIPNYETASGSVDRRIFLIEFNYKILGGGDPNLFEKMVQNIDLFHRKSVSLYLETVRKYGDKDIWTLRPAFLSQQIYDFQASMRSQVDILFKFLTSSTFEYDENFKMPLKEFKVAYSGYRKDNGYGTIKWHKDHYGAAFQDRGIAIQQFTENIDGKQIRAEWLVGIQQLPNAD